MSASSSSPSAPAPSRPYHSTLRAEQAAHTRRRILEAAADCFAERGYAGTSLGDIATRASVSVETVKLNGPKRNLLLGAFEQAFTGTEGPESVTARESAAEILTLTDGERFLDGLVHWVAQANARTSALWVGFVSAGASDPQVGAALRELLERRRADYRRAVDALAERDMLPADAERDDLADALSFLLSPEGHDQLVRRSGWTMEHYEDWLGSAVRRLALRP